MSDLSCWQHRRQIREALLLRKGVWGLAACHSRASKQARLVERKVCFNSHAGNQSGEGWQKLVQRSTSPPLTISGARAFIDRWRGLHAETAQSALTVIFKFVVDGLTSVILIVLGTVNLQSQGPFVPISLRPVLGIVIAHVLGTVLLIKQLTFPPGVLVPKRQLRGYCSKYYLQPSRKNYRSQTMFNDYIIIIQSPLTVFLCFRISHFSD